MFLRYRRFGSLDCSDLKIIVNLTTCHVFVRVFHNPRLRFGEFAYFNRCFIMVCPVVSYNLYFSVLIVVVWVVTFCSLATPQSSVWRRHSPFKNSRKPHVSLILELFSEQFNPFLASVFWSCTGYKTISVSGISCKF